MLAPVDGNPDGDVWHRDVEPRDLPPQPRHLLLPVLRLLPLHQSQLSIATISQSQLSIATINQSGLNIVTIIIQSEYSPAPPSWASSPSTSSSENVFRSTQKWLAACEIPGKVDHINIVLHDGKDDIYLFWWSFANKFDTDFLLNLF